MSAFERNLPNISRGESAGGLPPGFGDGLALLSIIDQPVWIYDFDLARMEWANPAALRFWEAASLDDLQDRDFNPTSLGTAERLANLKRSLAGGETRTESWTFFPQGRPLRRDCRLSGVGLADGRMAMLVEATNDPGPIGDLTYELRAIEAVRQAPLMISMVTDTGQWLMQNSAAEALVHALGIANLPGLDNFAALFADRDAALALRATALAEGAARATMRMAGRVFRMHEVGLSRLNDPVSGHISLMLSQQDVTRAFRMERRLQKALARERTIAQTQRQFLSVTSHDFRTPLAVIDGAARRIERMADPASPVFERAKVIRDTARHMIEAVDRTLSWASIAEGKVDFHPERASLRPLVEKALISQRAVHPFRPFVAELADVSEVIIDAGLVVRVLDNLLSNAIKYSPADAPIEVRCFERSGEVFVSVTDHGIGIPAADLSRLFSRFFRSSNARKIKGSGVGLHAARFYMELHGGRISVKTIEGKGSTFTVAFPLTEKAGYKG